MEKPYKYVYTKRITTNGATQVMVQLPFETDKLIIAVHNSGEDQFITFNKTAEATEAMLVTRYASLTIELKVSSFYVLSDGESGYISLIALAHERKELRDDI